MTATSGGGWHDVDAADDPVALVAWQVTMAGWPAVATYKEASLDLLGAGPGELVADVGCGPGADLLAMADRGWRPLGVDSSRAMLAAARRHAGGALLVAGDAHRLPLATASVAAARADRTLQHLADPLRAVAELVRVTRPGGRVVVADPDQSRLAITVPGSPLVDRIARLRRHQVRNGDLAGRMAEVLSALGAEDVVVQHRTLLLTDPSDAFGLPTWGRLLLEEEGCTAEEADAWESDVAAAAADGTFRYELDFAITAGRVAG